MLLFYILQKMAITKVGYLSKIY